MTKQTPRPMVQPWATFIESEESIIVKHAGRVVVFQGPGAKKVLPELISKLDGTSVKAEVLNSYPPEFQAAVGDAITRLERHNLLVDGDVLASRSVPESTKRAAVALAEALAGSLELREIIDRLHATHIRLFSDLSNASELEGMLRTSGFGQVDLEPLVAVRDIAPPLSEETIVVLAPRRATSPELDVMNERALSAKCRWTHVLPYDGSFASVGPLYLPGETGCYKCFQLRRRSTLETLLEHQRLIDVNPESVFDGPLSEWVSTGQEHVAWGILTRLLSMEALRFEWTPSPLAGHIHTIEWTYSSVEVSRHRLFRVPRCPSCGPLDLGVPQPWFDEPNVSVDQGKS